LIDEGQSHYPLLGGAETSPAVRDINGSVAELYGRVVIRDMIEVGCLNPTKEEAAYDGETPVCS
jgi:hypothetical protein